MGIHTAVHLSAYSTLCILNGKSSFGVCHPNNEGDDCEHDNRADKNVKPAAFALENSNCGVEESAAAGYDVEEQDYGNTVTDTAVVNLLTEPHDKRCTCNVCCYDNKACEHAFVCKSVLVLHCEVITESGDYCQCNSYIS